MMNSETLWDLFKACDTDGSGYIGLDEVRDICSKFSISPDDAQSIFENLDRDGDGQISFEDFREGFKDYERDFSLFPSPVDRKCLITNKTVNNNNQGELDDDLLSIDRARHSSNLKRVRSFTRRINRALEADESMDPEKQAKMIEELMESLKKLKEENDNLAKSYIREKREHEEHLYRIEQDVDSQVRQVEQRVTERAKIEIEAERRSLREMMKDEMNQLQVHLSMFEKVENWLKSSQSNMENEKLGEFRSKLEEALNENHQMRLSLLDTQTTVAMMRSELGQLKSLYEQRCKELNHEREKVLEVVHNQDYLTRQLMMLQTSNQGFQEISDNLDRSEVTSSWGPGSLASNASYDGPERMKKGSIVGDYLRPEAGHKPLVEHNFTRSNLEEIVLRENDLRQNSVKPTTSDRSTDSPTWNLKEDENDSGLSTITRDDQDELNFTSNITSLTPKSFTKDLTSSLNASKDVSDIDSRCSSSIGGCQIEESSSADRIPNIKEISGPGESLFNLIFIGDMSVGKTALIYRLANDQFLSNLCSTIGVDFHVKTYCVDNCKAITVQLWDTGGQERFRSITLSYFRKADGVILVYDVTTPQTFLNARNWMNQIQENSDRKIPVVLVANKIDLRDSKRLDSELISYERGYKLAVEFNCPFFEISAKQGLNVMKAFEAIIRKMMENEVKNKPSDQKTVVKLDEKSGFWAKKKCSTC